MIKYFKKSFCELFSKSFSYKFIDDAPDKIKRRTIYFIGHEGYYWVAVMACPCGCAQILYMNLISDHKPYWSYKIEYNRLVSLSPSVHRMVGCKSHFFIKRNRIIWA